MAGQSFKVDGKSCVEDLPVVFDVALSSAPWERLLAFSYVLSSSEVTANDLQCNLKCSRNKALMTIRTLETLGLVNLKKKQVQTEGGMQEGFAMSLKPEFEWFQSDEFRALWRQKVKSAETTEQTPIEEPVLEDFSVVQGLQKNGEYKKEDAQTNNQ